MSTNKTALVVGVLGQDGSYLAEHLLRLGYRVFGTSRRMSPYVEIETGVGTLHLLYCDLRDETSFLEAFRRAWPDEVYNLGGQVFVPVSWDCPAHTMDVNVGGLGRILNIVDLVKREDTKVYQASSSEMFGNQTGALNEGCPFRPVSPYGVSKAAAHELVKVYREKGLFVVGGILFNHESPRRGPEMVTRKIAMAVAQWAAGKEIVLELGHLSAERDWGFAGEYVQAMHLMLQQRIPTDYVIGTGITTSVGQFLEMACEEAGIEVPQHLIKLSSRMQRQNELTRLCADADKARAELHWSPQVKVRELVKMMVRAELEALNNRDEVKGVPVKAGGG